MFSKRPAYSLVFAGGGARGAYEIGAWKALRELNIRLEAVGGASVGAINAAVVAADSFDFAVKLWSEMTIDKVVKVPDGLLKKGRFNFSLRTLSHISELNFDIKNLGLDTGPLHKLLKENVDEERIRRKGMDLGIVTINIDNLQPCEIFLDDMPKGSLPDYLLASASFPAFRRAVINGKRFLDGGMYDNIPHSMMKNRGYRRIIVIDISGIGVNKRPDIAGTETIYIKNSMPLGNVLDFNPDLAGKLIELGYLDTMKTFGRNEGQKYFITGDSKLEQEYNSRLLKPEYIERYSEHLNLKGRKCSSGNAIDLIREILPGSQKSNRRLMLCLIEDAAAALDIERDRLYSLEEIIDEIRSRYTRIRQSTESPSWNESETFFKMIGERISLFLTDRETGTYCPYEYAQILRNSRAAETLFPELVPAEIFFSLLSPPG